jgi:hypothetical protein
MLRELNSAKIPGIRARITSGRIAILMRVSGAFSTAQRGVE